MLEFNQENHEYSLDGVVLPSVTTILSSTIFADKYDNVDEETLRMAAERGSLIHGEIENYIKKNEMGFTTELESFMQIEKDNELKNLQSEIMTTDGEVAGTIDLIAEHFGKMMLADIKTTYKLDKNYVAWQLSMYAYLYEKQTGIHIDELYAIWLRESEYKFIPVERKSNKDIEDVFNSFKNGSKIDFGGATLQTIPQEQLVSFCNILNQMKAYEKKIADLKDQMLKEMEDRNIYNMTIGNVLLTYKPATTKVSIDSSKLKEDGLYEKYTKVSNVKSSIMIKVKENKDE